MFLDKVKEKDGLETVDFVDEDYSKLSRHDLNGRQIKNAVRTAQALAVNEGKPLDMGHIAKVLDVAQAFEKDLKGGPGYEGMLYFFFLMGSLQVGDWSARADPCG